jgi:hypothetical protein
VARRAAGGIEPRLEASDASVPLTLLVGKVLRLGGLGVQVSGGPRDFAGHIDNRPPGCGSRLTLTMMFAR